MWVGVYFTGSAALGIGAHTRQLRLSSSPPLSEFGSWEMELAEKGLPRKREKVLGSGNKYFKKSHRLSLYD